MYRTGENQGRPSATGARGSWVTMPSQFEGCGPHSQPFHFHRKDKKPFAFAGLWEAWKPPEGELIRSCTIITCSANEVVAPVHDRMPVILSGESLWKWLEPAGLDVLAGFLKPYPADWMTAVPISKLVNNARLDSPEMIRPAA